VTYRSRCQLQRGEAEVLAIHCSDHRFQAGIRDFLDEGLNLRANYDCLVVPGGPECLVELETLPKFSWVSRKWSRTLIRMHSLKRLVLIAHQDCGWYKWLEEWHTIGASVRRKQEEDLRTAAGLARQLHPELTVELFFAAWDDGDAVTVDRV
jgi:hypothetical protein